MILFRAFHQIVGRRPVAMAIEQRPDYSAVQNSRKRFVLLFRFPFRDDFVIFWETANVQTGWVRRAAPPASVIRRITFLKRERILLRHRDRGLIARFAR